MKIMVDQFTLDKIKLLHPKLRDEAEHIYRNDIIPSLTGRSVCRFLFTLRTFDEQQSIYDQGRTKLYDKNGKRLGIVTNAKPGQSFHNYGLAVDIVLLVDRDRNGSFESASWDDRTDFDGDGVGDWLEVVQIFKKYGWNWGGDWKSFKDRPHFEKTFGYTWKDLLTKYTEGKFINGTKYVQI